MAKSPTLSPNQVSKALGAVAARKAAATIQELFFMAVLAGIYIGFGGIAYTVVTSPPGMDAGLGLFLGASIFSVGLMLVLLPGSELFTGNVLMSVGALSRLIRPRQMFRNWGIVWVGNFAGSLLLAYMMFGADMLGGAGGERAAAIADAKLNIAFWPCVFRGIMCNMLVCLAVIMATSAPTVPGKILAVYFPIAAFVICGFEHSIANMYLISAGLLAKAEFAARFWEMFENLVPVTFGNVIGGLAIVMLHPKHQKSMAKFLHKSEPTA